MNNRGLCVMQEVPKAYGLISKGNGDVILTKEKHMTLSVGGDRPDRDSLV